MLCLLSRMLVAGVVASVVVGVAPLATAQVLYTIQPPADMFGTQAKGLSRDGSTLVGFTRNDTVARNYRWTVAGGYEDYPEPPFPLFRGILGCRVMGMLPLECSSPRRTTACTDHFPRQRMRTLTIR
jgi:hypothetical protein